MNWKDRIEINPNILVGKPIIKGTRLSVELIVDLLSQEWSFDDLIRNYPGVVAEDILACLGYASSLLKEEKVYPVAI